DGHVTGVQTCALPICGAFHSTRCGSERETMKANVGNADRMLRVVVGLVLIGCAMTGIVGWWGWIGAVPLLTAVFGTCPLYSMLRSEERRVGERARHEE